MYCLNIDCEILALNFPFGLNCKEELPKRESNKKIIEKLITKKMSPNFLSFLVGAILATILFFTIKWIKIKINKAETITTSQIFRLKFEIKIELNFCKKLNVSK